VQAVALVAFERVSVAFEAAQKTHEATERRQAAEIHRARRTGTTAIVAAAIALAVAACAVWTAGQLADEVSAARVRVADAEARERFAVSAMADIVRASSARAVAHLEPVGDSAADECPPSVRP